MKEYSIIYLFNGLMTAWLYHIIFLIKNLWECESFSEKRLIKEFSIKNWKEWTLDDFLWKLQTTGSIECTVMIDIKMCCLYVVFSFTW